MLSKTASTLLLALLSATAIAAEPADLILTGGKVKTPSGWADAVAVRQGVIVAVGDARSVAAAGGAGTTTIDVHGGTVLPGLHDMHVHIMFAGLEQFECGFKQGASAAVILDTVKACVAKHKPGDWIKGGNWVAAVFKPGEQTRQALDKVAPDNPVLLNDEAHHSIWVNSKALALAHITRDTKDPEGGIIEHDAQGEPNGLLRERPAFQLVTNIVPDESDALKRQAAILATSQMLSFGITSFTDAALRANNIDTLSALSKEGLIKQRVRGCIVWVPGDPVGERLIADRARYAGPRFKTDCVKFYTDGVPTESHTAAMLEPYEGGSKNDHNLPEKGLVEIPTAALDDAVARFDRQGLHMKFHAVGDAAIRAVIDAVEKARRQNGFGGPMHDIAHSTFVDPADLPRAQALGMAWEFSPYIWYPTPITDVDIRKAVGEPRMARVIPIKEAVDTGALVVAGSDWSVIPSVNPWLAIETMVTRQKPGGGGPVIAERERISLDQAFKIFTENGARLMGDRDQVGSIEPGMRADLIVTETNPFEVPVTQVHDTKVRLTFIDGEKVYDAANPPKLKAE